MKRPIGLWIFGITGIVINLLSGAVLFMMFLMPAQAFFWNWFVAAVLALLSLFIVSVIGLFGLKKWGRNIFAVITMIMSGSMILLFSRLNIFSPISIGLLIFIISFLFYFFYSSAKELFK